MEAKESTLLASLCGCFLYSLHGFGV